MRCPRGPLVNVVAGLSVVLVFSSVVLASGIVASTSPGGSLAPGAPREGVSALAPTPAALQSVTFHEAGLPGGTEWSVTFNGTEMSGTGGSITFSSPNGMFAYSVGSVAGYVPSPSSGTLTVAGHSVQVTIDYSPLARGTSIVEFTQTGLLAGTTWSVSVNGTTESSTGATIQIAETNGTYWFTVEQLQGYIASPASATFSVKGVGVDVAIAFARLAPATYPVTFEESGLALGTSWSVTFNGSTESSTGPWIVFDEPNGTPLYTVGPVANYTSNPISGALNVAGAPTSQEVTFAVSPVKVYPVTFTESGLPNGTTWSMTLNGTTASSTTGNITFYEPKGVYDYEVGVVPGYTSVPASGVLKSASWKVVEDIFYWSVIAGHQVATFRESGLPFGATWAVTIGSITNQANGSVITFTEPNGYVGYTVAASGYLGEPASGTLNLTEQGADETVAFAPMPFGTFVLSFAETGLAEGTNWSVTAGGVTKYSIGSTIEFAEPGGSVHFSIPGVSDESATVSAGTAIVDDRNVTQDVRFQSASTTPGLLGLPGDKGAYLLAAVVAIVVVLGGVGVLLFRRPRRPPVKGFEGPKPLAQSPPPS